VEAISVISTRQQMRAAITELSEQASVSAFEITPQIMQRQRRYQSPESLVLESIQRQTPRDEGKGMSGKSHSDDTTAQNFAAERVGKLGDSSRDSAGYSNAYQLPRIDLSGRDLENSEIVVNRLERPNKSKQDSKVASETAIAAAPESESEASKLNQVNQASPNLSESTRLEAESFNAKSELSENDVSNSNRYSYMLFVRRTANNSQESGISNSDTVVPAPSSVSPTNSGKAP
jgi:hypothetical protein